MSTPTVERLHRQRAVAQSVVDRIPEKVVPDPRGGRTTVSALVDDVAGARDTVRTEQRGGSERHRRISTAQRWQLRLLPVLDGLVLSWFLVGVLNVDLRRPDATLVVALALAVLCTIAVAAWVATVGRHLRRYKNDTGDVVWTLTDGTARGMLALTAVAVLMLGVVMYVRVSDEVFQATGVGGPGAAVVAVVLAVAVVLVNVYVLYLSFADGSPLTTEADRLGRAVRKPLRRRESAQARVDRLTARIASRERAERDLHRPATGTDRLRVVGPPPEESRPEGSPQDSRH